METRSQFAVKLLPSLADIAPDHQVSCFLYPEVQKLEDKDSVAG